MNATITEWDADTQIEGVTIDLGCVFNYTPYVGKARVKVRDTAKASFIERSVPRFVHGENAVVSWTLEGASATVAKTLYDEYTRAPQTDYIFRGKLGEEYVVCFSDFQAEPQSGRWRLNGEFRIKCITTEVNFCQNC